MRSHASLENIPSQTQTPARQSRLGVRLLAQSAHVDVDTSPWRRAEGQRQVPKQARVKQVSRDARPPGDATQAPAPHVPQHTRNTGSRAPVHASHLTNWISSTSSIDQLAALVDDHAHELTSIHINAAFTRLAGLASEAPSASNRRPSSPSPHPSARQQQRAGSNSAPSRAPAHQPPSHAQNSAQEHLASSLLQLTTAQLPKLQPWQLANILHCCSKAGHKPSYSWTEKLLERLEPHIASLNTISLTNTLVSLAALDHKVRQPWMAKALAQVRLKAHTFEGHQLARVVHSVVQISPQQYHFTLELVAAARPRLKQLQLRMQVRMLHSVAKAAAAAASSAPAAAAPDVPAPALQHESLQELARSIIRQVGHLDAQDVAMVLWALAKLQQQLGSLAAPPAPLPAAATAGARPGPKIAVSRPAAAAAAAGAEQQEQQPGVHMKIMPSLPPAPKRRATQAPAAAGPAAPAYTQAWVPPAAKDETQASSTTSSAASKAATSKAAAAAALLLQAIAPVLEQAQQRLTDFNGQGLGMVCYAIARLNAKLPHSFWQQYMAAVQAQLARMNGQALANVIWGLGHSRATLSRRTLLSLDAAAAQQMQQMDAAGLVALLTGFRALGHRKPSPAFAVAVLATARKQMPGVGIRELVAVLGACHWMGMGSRVDAGLLRLAAGRICQLSGHSDSRSSSVERLGAAGLAPGAMCGALLVLARCGAGKQWLDAATGAALQGSTLPLLQSASGSQLCVLLYALARMAAVNQARWLAQWASAAAAKLSMCSAADLATVLAGLALVEAGPSAGPLVHAVLVRARGKLPYMTSRQLVTVAWALARLQGTAGMQVEQGWLDDLCTALGRQMQPQASTSASSDNSSDTPSSDVRGVADGGAAAPAGRQGPAGLSYQLRWRLGQALQRLRYWPSHAHGKYIWRLLRSLSSWRSAQRKTRLVLGPQQQQRQQRRRVLVRTERKLVSRKVQPLRLQAEVRLTRHSADTGGSRSHGMGRGSRSVPDRHWR